MFPKVLKITYAMLAFVMVILLSVAVSMAQVWHPLNQATVAWDAVTELSNGDPVPEIDTVFYRTYMKGADDNPPMTLVADNIAVAQYTFTISTEGRFLVAVQAVRWIGGDSELEYTSYLAWSDNPDACADGNTFGLDSYLGPMMPDGIYLHQGP